MGQPPDLNGGIPPKPQIVFERNKQLTSSNPGPNFLVISRVNPLQNEDNLSKVSPFLIKKVIDGTCSGEVELCKKLRNGTVLIKTKTLAQAQKLIQLSSFSDNIKVTVSEHNSLNFVKGVLYSNDLRGIPEDVILEELKSQNVVKVQKILKKEVDSLKETGLIIITFEALTLPSHLFEGYEKMNLRPYIPLPMRCHNCFTFGHLAKFCKKEKTCANCGQENHIHPDLDESCDRRKLCLNCKAANGLDSFHSATDKKCPIFLKEKEIQAIITLEKVNRYTAITKYNERHPQNNNSYASVTKSVPAVSAQSPPEPATSSRSIVDYSDTSSSILDIKSRISKKKKTLILPIKSSARARYQVKKASVNPLKDSLTNPFDYDTDDVSMHLE